MFIPVAHHNFLAELPFKSVAAQKQKINPPLRHGVTVRHDGIDIAALADEDAAVAASQTERN